jgi:DNA polymerase I-like protein with 3'-5' exonuclease and polymerase domains
MSNPNDTFDPASVAWVHTDADLAHLMEAIAGAVECVIDLETTGLDEHATRTTGTNGGYPARIVLASLTLPTEDPTGLGDDRSPGTWVIPLSHPEGPWHGQWVAVMTRIAQQLLDLRMPLVNQNMKFDARWVYAHTRVDLSHQIVWDTRVGSSLLDETSSTKLKVRAPAVFGIDRWDDFDLSTPGAAERVPVIDLGLYAARDTYWTWKLAGYQRDEMRVGWHEEPESPDEFENARLGLLARMCAMPSVAAMTAVEQRGMALDIPWVHARLAANEAGARERYDELVGMYDIGRDDSPSFAPTSHWFRDWAEAAVERGDLQVIAMTKTAQPQWTKEVLGKLARNGSTVAGRLLEYRQLTKQMEFLRSWLACSTPTEEVFTTYNIGGAATGRLSSSGPNMQQVSKPLRPAFVPRAGYVLGDFDLSQIELRIAAFLSRSEPMMQAFREGADLHTRLAARITGKFEDDVTPEERQKGKSANFGLLFDMGTAGFRIYAENQYGVVMSFQEADAVREGFFSMWTGVRHWQDRQRQRARATGQVTSPLGRVRRIPEMFSGYDPHIASGERIAINSPVQGMASDILQIAIGLIEGTIPGSVPVRDVRVVGSVHDSIVAELPADDWASAAAVVLEVMTNSVLAVVKDLGCDFDVPLAAEATIGTRWGLDDIGRLESQP